MTEQGHAPDQTATTPPRVARRRPGAAGTGTFGLILVAAGVLWLLHRLEVVRVDPAIVLPSLLVAVGVAVMISALDGEHGGLIAAGIFLSVLVVVASAGPLGLITSGVGERVFEPGSSTELPGEMLLGIGELRIDLNELTLDERRTVRAELGLGELRLQIPQDVPVEIKAHVGAGEITLFGEKTAGTDARSEFRSADFGDSGPGLTVELDVGIGAIEVNR